MFFSVAAEVFSQKISIGKQINLFATADERSSSSPKAKSVLGEDYCVRIVIVAFSWFPQLFIRSESNKRKLKSTENVNLLYFFIE